MQEIIIAIIIMVIFLPVVVDSVNKSNKIKEIRRD